MSAADSAVLKTAMALRWSAPEVTVALAEHAARSAMAAGDECAALQAWGWALHGRIALGEGSSAAVRAVEAVGGPARLGDSVPGARLRLGIATLARQIGELAGARELLWQIIEVADEASQLRADALVEAARCAAADPEASDDELEELLESAGDAGAGGDSEQIVAAILLGVAAAADRRRGHLDGAVEAARRGLERLRSASVGTEPVASAVVAELSLQLVHALLDAAQPEAAAHAAQDALGAAPHPGSVEPLGWLRLLLVKQQLHVGSAAQPAALESLDDLVRSLHGRDLPELEAECHATISELHEQLGDFGAALAATRTAHAAATRHGAAVEAVRLLLAQCPRSTLGSAAPSRRAEHRVGTARIAEPAAPASDGPAAPLDKSELGSDPFEQVPDAAPRHRGERQPASAIVVAASFAAGSAPPDTARELLVRIGAKVCGALPAGGRLHPLNAGALAVVLPGYGETAAQQWADSLRTELTEHWPELVGDLPEAVIRVAVGHQSVGQGVEALIHELRGSVTDLAASAFEPAADDGVGWLTQPSPVVGMADVALAEGVRPRANGGQSLRDQWAAAGAFGQQARASVLVAERAEPQPVATAPEPRIGELSFAELLAGALAAYREK